VGKRTAIDELIGRTKETTDETANPESSNEGLAKQQGILWKKQSMQNPAISMMNFISSRFSRSPLCSTLNQSRN
jgi:hypothetical protein